MEKKSNSVQREIFNFSPTTNNNKLRRIITRLGGGGGGGGGCQRRRTVGPWSIEEKKFHMNVAKLRAVKLAIMSFTLREKNAILVQIRMGKMTVLSYLMKM